MHCRASKVVEFGVVQAHRTFSNHIIAEIPRSVEFYDRSLGWFAYTEPSLPGEARCTGASALVLGGSSTSNLLKPHHC